MPPKIAPSILSADFSNLLREIKMVESVGISMIHIDVMDGHFVPNITIGPVVLECLRKKTNLIFDTHLMIETPEKYIDAFVKAGSERVIVHAEASPHLHRITQCIKEKGAKAGVALNPSTPLSQVEHMLDEIDILLIMTVNPGFGGQRFITKMLSKIKVAREMIDKRNIKLELEVDGGINRENAKLVAEAGANVLVAGYAVFGEGDVRDNICALQALVSQNTAR